MHLAGVADGNDGSNFDSNKSNSWIETTLCRQEFRVRMGRVVWGWGVRMRVCMSELYVGGVSETPFSSLKTIEDTGNRT